MVSPDDSRALVSAIFPPPYDNNPYQRMLHAALERRGVTITAPGSVRRMWRLRARRTHVVHLHWVEYLVFTDRRGRWLPAWFFPLLNAMHVVAAVTGARMRGIRVIWTMHNLRPHDPRHPRVEAAALRALALVAHAIVVHSRFAALQATEAYGTRVGRKLHVVRDGSFDAAYRPSGRTRAETRADLGLPADAFVYLVFGAVRRYKQIPRIIRAFATLENPDARLLITGQVNSSDLRAEIEALAADDERVVLRFGFVPDEEVDDQLRAADVLVIGYDEVFSSGALRLALGKGLPAVVPARGTAHEIASGAITTFEPRDLPGAIARVRCADLEDMALVARRLDAQHTWEAMAESTLALYRGPVEQR